MRRLIYSLTLLACLAIGRTVTGCVDTYEAKVGKFGEGCLVIEGNIVSDSAVVFRLSRTFSLADEQGTDDYRQVDATVCVRGSDGSCWQGVAQGNGAYKVEIGTLSKEETYSLEVEYNGDTYTSNPQQPLESDPVKLEYSQPEEEGDVHLTLSALGDGSVQYYQWLYEEDWEVRTEYSCNHVYEIITDSKGNVRGVLKIYDTPPYSQGWCSRKLKDIWIASSDAYTDNVISKMEIKEFTASSRMLAICYSILLTQRNMTKEEYEYYKCRNKVNTEMGGLFTPQPTELPSNISCSNPDRSVVGYIGCNLSVEQKRLFIFKGDIQSTYSMLTKCLTILENEMEVSQPGTKLDWVKNGYQILMYEEGEYYWGDAQCVDIRTVEDVSLIKPDFWPDLGY